MHCGLRIQIHCRRCDHHHPAFYPYCPACGAPTERDASAPEAGAADAASAAGG